MAESGALMGMLTDQQRRRYDEFQEFAATVVAPCAAAWDRAEAIPTEARRALAARGYLGCLIPPEYGGRGWDVVTFGLLNEALGRESSAYTGMVTVQAMVSMAVLKWGSEEQKQEWLPSLASGERMAAFALTEPEGGSTLRALKTEFRRDGSDFVVNGAKRWISCGQFADVFLVFGGWEGQSVACLLPSQSPGLRVEPISELIGFRAAGLATLEFHDVTAPAASMVGRPGFATSHVAPLGLQFGRISTACSALGLLRGCLEESARFAGNRKVGGTTVGDFGMVRTLIARMGTNLEAAALLCNAACRAEDEHRPDAFQQTLMAKYFASRAAVAAASDAVQVCGASGCHGSSPVSRYYRDAKIMEIIEGTTQIHEDVLGKMFLSRVGEA